MHKLATLHYGASLELLKPEILSAQKKAWKTLGGLIDTWGFLASQQQSFLVEAVERIHVNLDLNEMSISLLDTALGMARSRGEQNAVHALLLVNTKLLALYSRYVIICECYHMWDISQMISVIQHNLIYISQMISVIQHNLRNAKISHGEGLNSQLVVGTCKLHS